MSGILNRPRGGATILPLSLGLCLPQAAAAIPSPELVIGSVSSFGQLFALGAAMLGGGAAFAGRRFGRKNIQKTPRYVIRILRAVAVFAVVAAGLNLWQFQSAQTSELQRLQATLIRPAQFDGTTIKDENLKETSFSDQMTSGLSVTTEEAQRLLSKKPGTEDVLFIDVREGAENQMGTLPGARHIRFPDLATAGIPMQDKKVVLFCHNGNRSSETCARLAAQGIDCRFIAGGIEKWIVEGRPFSDASVRNLSDLRAIPDYPNKDRLLNTKDVHALVDESDIQFVDVRYPGDFDSGHLPGAFNIPLRAMQSEALEKAIATIPKKPVVAACYDRRSCFISQVLGLELTRAGYDFQGRYTVPWEYFVAKPPKPHVADWQAQANQSYWQKGVGFLSALLVKMSGTLPPVLVVLALAIVSRILILPIALKAERDQIVTARHKTELVHLKETLKSDPTRKLKAIRGFYRHYGITPGRNLLALVFLPVTMLGLSVVEMAAPLLGQDGLAVPDPTYLAPVFFAVLGGVYIQWSLVSSVRGACLCWLIGAPVLFALVVSLTLLSTTYLCFALLLLLVQRGYVTGAFRRIADYVRFRYEWWWFRSFHHGLVPLGKSKLLTGAGNKALRLSMLLENGAPVPSGVVLDDRFLDWFVRADGTAREKMVQKIVKMSDGEPFAVRSSASAEDGASQSFAGVYESELHVRSEILATAIDRIYQSFEAERVASYAEVRGNRANILIQKLVPAEFAGVLFTCDPDAPGMMLGEYAAGHADDLVSGRVTPKEFHMPRSGPLSACEVLPFDGAELYRLACIAEEIFGAPQDIEWTSENGRIWIVQSRDITTLNSGTADDKVRRQAWTDIIRRFNDQPANQTVLEMDEMTEVLPRPTPLSLSYMQEIWAPGGSVDLACRSFGLSYDVSEQDRSQLVTVFGRLYVDTGVRDRSAVRLSASAMRRLEKDADTLVREFEDGFLPGFLDRIARWEAQDFTKLPHSVLLEELEEIHDSFIHDTHCEVERINIAASCFARSSELAGKESANSGGYLRSISPSGLYQEAVTRGLDNPKTWVRDEMAHRAVFDYELSEPRYGEIPTALNRILDGLAALPAPAGKSADVEPNRFVKFQNLKEEAKHQALKHLAVLRRALLALDTQLGSDGLVFYLRFAEILGETFTPENLEERATQRRNDARILNACTLLPPRMTRLQLEQASCANLNQEGDAAANRGKWVSGQGPVSGRVFIASLHDAEVGSELEGFDTGDILVCPMIHPSWLPHVISAAAVVSEVGGALSHMAIIARENRVPMLVGVAAPKYS